MEKSYKKIIKKRGLLLILSSPSGAGKTTIAQALLQKDSALSASVSVTTRPKRDHEKHGCDYFFTDKKEFQKLSKEDAFLENAHVFGHHYGTLKREVKKLMDKGHDVVFDIDWQGTQQIKKNMQKDTVTVFILPPSLEELRKRLYERGQDNPEVIEARMQEALSEISHYTEYDYVVINENLERSISKVYSILKAERLKRFRQQHLDEFIERYT